MTDPNILAAIRSQRDAALARAAKHDEFAAKARADAADYEAAERVLAKMTSGSETMGALESSVAPIILKAEAQASKRKPENIPPVPDMIIEALRDAQQKGAPGLTPSGLLSYIKQRYWSDARSPDVGSTAWRMWKDGRLTRPSDDPALYGLPNEKENAA